MFSRLSIRARLTIGTVLFAALFFGAALVVVRGELASTLESSDRSLASGDLTSYRAEIEKNPSGLIDDSGTGTLVLLRDPTGRVALDTLPHDIHQLVEHRPPANTDFEASVDGVDFVVVGQKLVTSSGTWALWSARSRASSELALRGFDVVLGVGGIVLLLAFAVASWLLGSAALRPVTRMRLQAENLSSAEGASGLPVGNARDEITALAVTLNAFLDRVRRSTAREKQVVSDAAHELRTPLAALKTQLELAHGNFDDAPALAAQVVAAERTVERLSSLATNLLALSRLEGEGVTLQSSLADELIGESMDAIDRARLIGLARSVEVIYVFDVPYRGASYPLSRTSFGRVLDNLLSNAVAATADSSTVSLGIRQLDGALQIEVADEGPGMPPEFLARAFDRFSRADDSRTAATGGTGLGLALVKAICTAAGGDVSLENRPTGLIVRVQLPHM